MVDIINVARTLKTKIVRARKDDPLGLIKFFVDDRLGQIAMGTNGRTFCAVPVSSDGSAPIQGLFTAKAIFDAASKKDSLLIEEQGHGRFVLRVGNQSTKIVNHTKTPFVELPRVPVGRFQRMDRGQVEALQTVAKAASAYKDSPELSVVHVGTEYVDATCRYWHARAWYPHDHLLGVGLNVAVEAVNAWPARFDAVYFAMGDAHAWFNVDGIYYAVPRNMSPYIVSKARIPRISGFDNLLVLDRKDLASAVTAAKRASPSKIVQLGLAENRTLLVSAWTPDDPLLTQFTADIAGQWLALDERSTPQNLTVLLYAEHVLEALKLDKTPNVLLGFPKPGATDQPVRFESGNVIASLWQMLPNREVD